MEKIRLGTVLIENGSITEEQLHTALSYQQNHREKRLGEILIDMGFVTEIQVLHGLANRLKIQVIDLKNMEVDLKATELVPQQLAEKYDILAIRVRDQHLEVATNDPLNFYAMEDIQQLTSMQVVVKLAKLEDVQEAISNAYSEISAKKAANQANESSDDEFDDMDLDVDIEGELDSDVPIIKLLNSLVRRAYNINASDIHIEPFEDKTTVRMRIDGMIVDYLTLKRSLHASIIARIKIIGGLDIAEKRIPQDGHFKMTVEDESVNLRVSVIPTVFGEKAVLRLLSNKSPITYPESFGMNETDFAKFKPLLESPNGIIYMTGPTGSGKTTTLYMILEYLSQRNVNISTIEDPVEKNIPRLNQMQVNQTAGLTFEVGLRALLRQDPDIIMVGETRDAETASISVRAAITGHLVLSTIHTNTAISSIVRLIDMGLEPYLIANSLVGLVAQRLMRKVCPECCEERPTTPEERELLGEDVLTVKEAVGCPKCNNTGYKGRIAIHEIAVIDKEVRKMITEERSTEEIEDYIIKYQGMKTLGECAKELVANGTSTMEELWKVAYYA